MPVEAISTEWYNFLAGKSCRDQFCAVMHSVLSNERNHASVGLHCDHSTHDGTFSSTTLLQLHFPNEKVLVIIFSSTKELWKSSFPKALKIFLQNENLTFANQSA